MKMLPLKTVAAVFGLLFCTGCFVKEDRESCPCRLWIDFSEIDGSVADICALLVTADNGIIFSENLEAADLETEKCVLVPRTELVVGLWSGVGGMLQEDGMSIVWGHDCPPVYFHTSVIDADCEQYREKLCLRKNHCVMTVELENMDQGPDRIAFYGNVNGYGIDGSPSAGDFSYVLRAPLLAGNRVILPRQLDDSLRMEIVDSFGISRIFAIGEYVADMGYDWNSPDLKDITLSIDIAMARVSLEVQGWDESYSYGIVM